MTVHMPTRPAQVHQWRGVIEEYRDWLPLPEGTPTYTLREGGTPLVDSPWLSEITGADVWIKVEGSNPTGSFKDRGMTVALSVAVGQGAEAVVCASTGNTSASMAAYAARAGVKPLVLVPQGKISAGKLAQAIVHGAQVIMVRGNFDDCLRISRELAEHYPVALVNSVNPMRLQGQKTASFEIVDFLGDAPDVHLLPVGNAGNISAYWLGYQQYADLAADLEGHPDNVAPAFYGGFVISGRAALLVAALNGQPEHLLAATRDWLHQDQREPAMPETLALVRRLRAEGVPAVVSGAGPTVLAFGSSDTSDLLSRCPNGWTPHQLSIDVDGARLT